MIQLSRARKRQLLPLTPSQCYQNPQAHPGMLAHLEPWAQGGSSGLAQDVLVQGCKCGVRKACPWLTQLWPHN